MLVVDARLVLHAVEPELTHLTAPGLSTGFQTHDTPALLATGDRAELASEKYVSVSPLLEGIVIVKRNPAFVEGND